MKEPRSELNIVTQDRIRDEAAASAFENIGYGYEQVRLRILLDDLNFSADAAQIGDELPDFDLPTTRGERVRRRDLIGDKPILLFSGSLSCPMAVSSNIVLKQLHRRFGHQITFLMIYVREAHPGESCPQPRALNEKLQHARRLKERDGLPWVVAADDIQGSLHCALDPRPNVAYLADRDGRIIFRALCAGDRRGVTAALEAASQGQMPRVSDSRGRLVPLAEGIGNLRAVTGAAGRQSQRDIWRAVPPIAALAWFADLFHPFSAKWRTLAAVATICSTAVGAAIWSSSKGR